MYGGYFRMNPDGSEQLPPKIGTPETESYSNMVTWEFPERQGLPALRMTWYDGGLRPPRPMELPHTMQMPIDGVLYIGERGKLMSGYYGGKNLLLPERRFKDFQTPPKTLKRTIGHYKEWVAACRTGSPTNVNFEFGSRMTEVALLGTIAVRCARTLEYDTTRPAITNDAEANGWLNPPYRDEWLLSS